MQPEPITTPTCQSLYQATRLGNKTHNKSIFPINQTLFTCLISHCFTLRLMLISKQTLIYLPPYTVATPDVTVVVSHHTASSVDSIADYYGFNTVVCRAARIQCRHGVPSSLLTHNNGSVTEVTHCMTLQQEESQTTLSGPQTTFHNQTHAIRK